ncbi:GH25 family lysozyme [Gryllotalpicola koreensis]|uniref:Uncharacterized protein n=1 Tax=Gryllotalpicola koreensis TaxID=993086 RepID=A0ABP8A1N0_9MICO
MQDTVDVSWPQGDYSGGSVLIGIGAWSLDGGKPFVQSTYHRQVDNARRNGLRVIHYAFNGRTDAMSPAAFADYCYANLYDWRAGDGIALDVESSERGKYPSWSIAQADQFRAQLSKRMLECDVNLRLGIYGSRSDMGRAGWGAQEKLGCWLWIAWPGWTSGAAYGEWSKWYMLQYSTAGGIDHDHVDPELLTILDSQEDDMPLTQADANLVASALAANTGFLNAVAVTTLTHPLNSHGGLNAQVAAIYNTVTNPATLASAIAAKLPAGSGNLTEAQIEAAVKSVFADAAA